MTGRPLTVVEMDVAALCVARKRKFDAGKELNASIENGSVKAEGKYVTMWEEMYFKEMDRIEKARALSALVEGEPLA
jgi:hypothetical protein